jgi:NitT/TauT family transport system ATP-binding protein
MDRARGRALAQGRAGGPVIPPKLDVARLSKYFYGRGGEVRKVLEDITVSIAEGEFVCIVGASGCGKTTFIRCIAGLLPAEEGEVRIDGQAVTRPGADRGFVFQSDALMPWRTVMQNVLFGLEVRGRRLSETKSIGEKLLDLVGLTGFEDHYPNELSGGMRQRVNLARALAIEPQVLLMDEPFAALDAQTREIMQRELLKIWAKERKTVLFITHQIDEAIYLADRVLVFSHRPGRIAADIRISFARPRDLALKRSPEFLRYVDDVWKLIEDEVVSAMTATRAGVRREQGH